MYSAENTLRKMTTYSLRRALYINSGELLVILIGKAWTGGYVFATGWYDGIRIQIDNGHFEEYVPAFNLSICRFSMTWQITRYDGSWFVQRISQILQQLKHSSRNSELNARNLDSNYEKFRKESSIVNRS